MSYANPPMSSPSDFNMPLTPRTSGLAIAAFVCALLFCVPFLFSAVAVLLGLIAVLVTGKPHVKGRMLAISAVLLGALGIAGWAGISMWVYNTVIAPTIVPVQFSAHLAKGDLAAARALTAPPFDPASLQELQAKFTRLGTFKSMLDAKTNSNPFTATTIDGVKVYSLDADVVFANGVQRAVVEIRQTPEGWRLTRLSLTDPPASTTLPATVPAVTP